MSTSSRERPQLHETPAAVAERAAPASSLRPPPSWLPSYVPELDGLRGIAVGAVVLYHCHAKLASTPLGRFVELGWAGVNLFFVLSGFLITGIILDSRPEATNPDGHFFRNFYARRSLRIWPVYVLLLALHYLLVPLIFLGTSAAMSTLASAPWIYYALFVQNLFSIGMPGPITPTWSLAIEEQYYLAWAPLARKLSAPVLATLLIAVIIASPILRAWNPGTLIATNTLIHLDGIAFGSLIALLLRTGRRSGRRPGCPTLLAKREDGDLLLPCNRQSAIDNRQFCRLTALSAITLGLIASTYFLHRGSALTDSTLALFFAGLLLLALTTTGQRSPYATVLRCTPLRFLGKISYGLYMIHVLAFVLIGRLDEIMLPHGNNGAYLVVATRIALSVTLATLLWYGFERPILKLKKRFESKRT